MLLLTRSEIASLLSLDDYIRIRNRNYTRFVEICARYPHDLIVIQSPGVSSFVLPFLFREPVKKQQFQRVIQDAGIESRPLISGNLLRQPFLRRRGPDDQLTQQGFRRAALRRRLEVR